MEEIIETPITKRITDKIVVYEYDIKEEVTIKEILIDCKVEKIKEVEFEVPIHLDALKESEFKQGKEQVRAF